MGEPVKAEIILYQNEGANVPVKVWYKDDDLWLPQKAMAELFGVSVQTISEHLSNIFASGELQKPSVTSFSGFSGKTSSKGGRPAAYYNLDAVIAVGYRVNSLRATRFRQWATATLKEYIVKGFVLNDDMLKNGAPFGKDYFDELLVRIRDIRASERRVYQKITDIFQECTYDYDRNSEVARNFYATVQNKLHYAVTSSSLRSRRWNVWGRQARLSKWQAPCSAARGLSVPALSRRRCNHLTEKEIRELNRLVTMFLDAAEDRAERHQLTSMEDCKQLLDGFLAFNGREVLQGLGNRNKKTADKIALERFAEYRKVQDVTYENDFEKAVKRLQG